MLHLVRRYAFVAAISIFFLVSYLLYSSLDASSTKRKELMQKDKTEVDRLEEKLHSLEGELNRNEQLISDIRQKIYAAIGQRVYLPANRPNTDNADNHVQHLQQSDDVIAQSATRASAVQLAVAAAPVNGNVSHAEYAQDVCAVSNTQSQPGDHVQVQMLDTYAALPFDNINGGVWKQGWPISYEQSQVASQSQLQVFLVPHSHCDPGWIQTFEGYYSSSVRKILDNMLQFLPAHPKMKFIYAETSFFERWWRDIDDTKRDIVRKLLKSGQFEIVNGGWVMNDEANPHYHSILDQMIEGHTWLKQQLDYTPHNQWSIDPFGLSATMPFLAQAANYSAMAVQRVHYSVKKHLAKTQQLEFHWRQLWAGASTDTDMLTHLFPFYSYDVPHTCGPEPAICCQFDFKRLPGGGLSCPWNKAPVPITQHNVADRAAIILDQWRKKAQLYRTNVVLVPLGDDFRYDTAKEWTNQYENYQLLFDYMNAQSHMNVKAQFGTLEDYFVAMRARVPSLSPPRLPVLSGDFFTYADRDDHYWSGYYTSRPFYKRMERTLMQTLRAAELLFTWTSAVSRRESTPVLELSAAYEMLVDARQQLALFQHHDGITGTAKDNTVQDYGKRLQRALGSSRVIMSDCAHYLMRHDRATQVDDALMFSIDDLSASHEAVSNQIVQLSAQPRSMLVFNSLSVARNELVCVHTDKYNVLVMDALQQNVLVQVQPIVLAHAGALTIANNQFKVCFVSVVPALGMSRYSLSLAPTDRKNELAVLQVNNALNVQDSPFKEHTLDSGTFSVSSTDYNATFSTKTGYLKSIVHRVSGQQHNVQIEFVRYGARRKGQGGIKGGDSLSGAYLFLPDGQAKTMTSAVKGHHVVVASGPLLSTVYVQVPTVLHTVTLTHNAHGLDAQTLLIDNLVDLAQESNYELAMRLRTPDINSKDTFYTDLNGLQMLRRRRVAKLPLQAHFYPMPTAAYVEDSTTRMTLLSSQPLGVASLESGMLEVMLDRRLNQDDDRGLFQGVQDNKVTPDTFRLLIEPMINYSPNDKQTLGALTSVATHSLNALTHPLFTLLPATDKHTNTEQRALLSMYGSEYRAQCDVHLVNMRTLTEQSVYGERGQVQHTASDQHALVYTRTAVQCASAVQARLRCTTTTSTAQVSVSDFVDAKLTVVDETSATLMYSKGPFTPTTIALQPRQIRTFRAKLN